MQPLRIAVVTGTRAEYGLLRTLVSHLRAEPAFEVSLLVTGTHLSEHFGLTVREIEADGTPIAARIPLPLEDDSAAGVTRATATAMAGFADAFETLQPDLAVILGDRSEAFAAAAAALLARVPIAHLHGGELTEGAVDDALRHAITKMSWLHFTSTEEYRRRVIQLGEDPSRVFCVGALGVDNALSLPLMSRDKLEADLGPVFGPRTAVVTFHPVTLAADGSSGEFDELLAALEADSDLSVVMTRPNADAGNRAIFEAIDRFVERNPGRVHAFNSLGAVRYLSLLAQVDVCIGNSSSGIIEAAAVGTPAVDIGDRQRGRVRPASVIHAEPDTASIKQAIFLALSPEMRELAATRATPYGDGHAAERITAVLKGARWDRGDLKKRFHDITVPDAGDGGVSYVV
jgi:GDP/UDP-N,N'-diacetylbacillosamine 2-epimerase (hydrolysing)